jgi:hypothetical protein
MPLICVVSGYSSQMLLLICRVIVITKVASLFNFLFYISALGIDLIKIIVADCGCACKRGMNLALCIP